MGNNTQTHKKIKKNIQQNETFELYIVRKNIFDLLNAVFQKKKSTTRQKVFKNCI